MSTPTSSAPTSCPTAAIYAIQNSADGLFATLLPLSNGNILDFNVADASGAAQFAFISDSNAGCFLTAIGLEDSQSVVLDEPGNFVDPHFVYIAGPDAGVGLTKNLLACQVDDGNVLTCTVQDQHVLQLTGSYLSISSITQGGSTQSTFVMVQV
jgi:hypothetical protein